MRLPGRVSRRTQNPIQQWRGIERYSTLKYRDNPLIGDLIQQAISNFAALPLLDKVAVLAAAAIKLEMALEKNGRSLGHPADRPWDYQSAIVCEMLGSRSVDRDDQAALVSGGYAASRFSKRAGVAISTAEQKLLSEFIGVFASMAPENQFACIVGGHELNPNKPAGLACPEVIRQHRLFAKMLQASEAYKKVFVGSFSFVDALSPDCAITDQLFSGICYVKQYFQYAHADIIVYAAGVEFPS